jgi:hypothetical protein
VAKAILLASGASANIDSPKNTLPERHTVQAAHQLVALEGLDAVRVAEAMQPLVAVDQVVVIQVPRWPGRGLARRRMVSQKACRSAPRTAAPHALCAASAGCGRAGLEREARVGREPEQRQPSLGQGKMPCA